MSDVEIPVIDLAGLMEGEAALPRIVAEIARACEQWGFFQVVNHGISEETLETVKTTARAFFDLPEDERLKYVVKPGSRAGFCSKKACNVLIEEENVFSENHVDHFYHFFGPAHLKAIDTWPRHPSTYREVMEAFSEEVKALALKLLGVCAVGLGLKEKYFIEALGGDPTFSIRINYYPPFPELKSRIIGLGEHSDPGGITVLLQGDIPGLQVRHTNSSGSHWVDVKAVENALVINIGDQLEILTNGRYKSVEHRGMLGGTCERLSLATFYSPSMDSLIAPATDLIDETHPCLYVSTLFSDFMASFYQRGLNGKNYVNRKLVQSANDSEEDGPEKNPSPHPIVGDKVMSQ